MKTTDQRIKALVHALLPKKREEKVGIFLSEGKNPNYVIVSDSKKVAKALARKLQQYSDHRFKPFLTEGNHEFHLIVSSSDMNKICNKLNLPFESKTLQKDLKNMGAQLKGYFNSSCKVVVNLNQKPERISTKAFKAGYLKDYNRAFFKNPKSTMKQRLFSQKNKDTTLTISSIKEYAKEKPSSRTAKVLNRLMYQS